MKQTMIKKLFRACFLLMFFFSLASCGEKKKEAKQEPKPLNISIFLDLSDRLTREMEPSQMSRDTAIVGYIADYFKQDRKSVV